MATPTHSGPNCGVFAASPPALKEEGQKSSTAPQLCRHFALFLHPNLSTRKPRNPLSSHLVALPGNPSPIASKQMAIAEPK